MSSASRSESDRLKSKLQCLRSKIESKIVASDPKNHRQYGPFANKGAVASLQIPNCIYHDWEAIMKLQGQLGLKVSSYSNLLNSSLAKTSFFLSVKSTMDGRIKKQSSIIRKKYTQLRGSKKTNFIQSHGNILVFNREVIQAETEISIPG